MSLKHECAKATRSIRSINRSINRSIRGWQPTAGKGWRATLTH